LHFHPVRIDFLEDLIVQGFFWEETFGEPLTEQAMTTNVLYTKIHTYLSYLST
jgi:hypothetical protein